MTLLIPTYIILAIILIVVIIFPVWKGRLKAVHVFISTITIVMLVMLTVLRFTDEVPLPSFSGDGLKWESSIKLDWNPEAKFKHLFRMVSTPAYIVNMDRQIQYVNAPAMELILKETGMTYDEIEGKMDIPEIMSMLSKEGVLLNADELKQRLKGLDKSKSRKYDVVIKRKNQNITFKVLALPIVVDGELQGRFISMIPVKFENSETGEIISPSIYNDDIIQVLEIVSAPR